MRLIQYTPRVFNRIMIVGEAPGRWEDEGGKPFIGPEGRYLTGLLKRAGIDRNQCFITNTAHVRPPRNVYDLLKKEQKDAGKLQLKDDILEWSLKGLRVIIALGAHALEATTGMKGITKYRGTVLPCQFDPTIKVLPTLHPGAIIRGEGRMEPVVSMDLKKAAAENEFPEIKYPERNIHIIRSIAESEAFLNECASKPGPYACDIENVVSSGLFTAYGIATDAKNAYVITMDNLKSPRVLRALGRFAQSPARKIFHNCLYDVFHNAYYYKILYRNVFFDTMLAQHAVFPMWPKSLAFCASIYTNEPYWKEDGKSAITGGRGGDDLYIYNGKDCCLTYEIYERLEEEIDYWQVRVAFNRMMNLVDPCLFANLRGITANPTKAKDFKAINDKAVVNLEKIVEATIGDINVNSPQQLKDLLYKQWDMPVQKKMGKVTTDANALKTLESYPTPYSRHIGAIRLLKDRRKRNSFCNLNLDPDGRLRTALKIHGTYTGRFSSSKSITGSGFNMQNQPKLVRMFYESDPGKIFLQMDLSQAEARVVAALCHDFEWLHDFDVKDLHSDVAAFLFNIPLEKVDRSTHRQTAKRVAHGSHYRLGVKLLSQILGCSMREARTLKTRYFEKRKSLYAWHDEIEWLVEHEKLIRTPFGRVIQFFGPVTDKLLREATAAEPQSTSADYLNEGIINTYKADMPEFEFLLQVHDSILCQVPAHPEAIYKVAKKMKEVTEQTIDVCGIDLKIPCDFEIGFNWKQMQEIKNLEDVETVFNNLHEAN